MRPILKFHIEKREFHHAYLLCGDGEAGKKMAEEAARVILAEDNLESHPDFSFRRFGLFGINDSHNLTSWAATKSFSGQGKVLVIDVFSGKEDLEKELIEIGRKFLAALPNKRLEMVKKLSAKSGEENELLSESSANKQKAVQFLNALEFLLHLDIECPSGCMALEELSRSRQFISDQGASAKIILEHLALALPIVK